MLKDTEVTNMKTDIFSQSFSFRKEKLPEIIDNFEQIRLSFVQQISQNLNKQIWQNQDLILKTIEQSKGNKYKHLGTILLQLFQENKQQFIINFQSSTKQIATLIKEKIAETLSNMPSEQIHFYQTVLKRNQELKKKFLRREYLQKPTVEQLMKLDILSIFFFENHTYRQKNTSVSVISPQEIQEILQISPSYYRKYLSFYGKVYKLIYFKHHQDIRDYIVVFRLIKAKMRLIKLRRFKNMEQCVSRIKNYHQNKISAQNTQQCDDIFNKYKYNYCQLAFLMQMNEKEEFSSQPIHLVISNYQKICQQPSQQLQKQIILQMKVKYKVSYSFLFRNLWYYQNNQRQRIQADQKEQKDELSVQKLYMTLPYILCQVNSLEKAFQTIKDRGMIGLQNYDYIKAIPKMILAARRKFSQLSTVQSAQLYLAKLIHQFLVVKKFQFSYQQLKGLKLNKKKDLICTLTLASNTKKLQFFWIKRSEIQVKDYFKILQNFLQTIKNKTSKLCILLFENEFSKTLAYRPYVRFASHIKSTYNFYLYITNNSQYCQLNILLYVYIKYKLSLVSGMINEDNFYAIVQRFIKQVLINFNKSQLKYDHKIK